MTRPDSTPSTPDPQADGRNGRVVGEKDDNPLESIGKAIVAPIEGADEDAVPADGEPERAFADLAPTPPQGQGTPRDPATQPTKGTAS